MQIMGILETRLLDFRHVILLSMNEEIMPAQQAAQSHIPYSLRLAFELPSREDMDAIYAYYFYRLLQRAERVDILFNGSTEGVSTGEMSRYAKQLIFEKDLKVIRPGLNVQAREVSSIVIEHGEEAAQKLMSFMRGSEADRYLSPSAINTYIDCSLKYYFRYIAGLGEMDEISEDIDASGFGTVVHDSLNELYLKIAGTSAGIISKEALEELLRTESYEALLKEQFIKHHYKGRKKEAIEGRNILIFSVMLRYMKQVLEQDISIAPFVLVSTEETYRRNLTIQMGAKSMEISLGGKIDRIDRVGGQLRVIDYKTGRTDQKFKDVETLFEGSYGNRNGAAFQTLFYAWLVGETFPAGAVMPGLYTMKGLFEENFDPALNMTSLKKEGRVTSFFPLEKQYMLELKEIMQKIFDPAVPFVQRDNDQKCVNCDYNAICQRKTNG
jgi:RecB family exonuclease